MKFIIDACVKNYGIKYLSERKLIESDLDLYSIIFKSKNDECCKLELFFNGTDVFRTKRKRDFNELSTSNSFTDRSDSSLVNKILNSIEIYPTLAEARTNMLPNPSEPSLSKYFCKFKENIQELTLRVSIPGITIHSVNFYFKPTLSLVLIYCVNGIVRNPLVIFIGKPIEILCTDECEHEFIQELNSMFSNPIQFY